MNAGGIHERYGAEMVVLRQPGNEEEGLPNLFEYATYRFKKAAHAEQRVTRRTANPPRVRRAR